MHSLGSWGHAEAVSLEGGVNLHFLLTLGAEKTSFKEVRPAEPLPHVGHFSFDSFPSPAAPPASNLHITVNLLTRQ